MCFEAQTGGQECQAQSVVGEARGKSLSESKNSLVSPCFCVYIWGIWESYTNVLKRVWVILHQMRYLFLSLMLSNYILVPPTSLASIM